MGADSQAQTQSQSIRLLLAEDHAIVAMALDAAFETVDDIELIGTVRLIEEAVEATRLHRPDLILLDRRLPDGDGIDAIGRLREAAPDCKVLLFTGAASRAVAERVIVAGGSGVAQKGSTLDVLLDVIRRVAAGQNIFDVGT